jgi:phosphoheptose isomerase
MKLFDFKRIEKEYLNVLSSEAWRKACRKFKQSKIILYYGHGGNLGVGDHAAIDVCRLTKGDKVGFSLGSSIATTSLANDEGYDNLFKSWLGIYFKGFEKNVDICAIGITSSGKSKNFLNALDFLEEKKINSFYLTASKLKKNTNFHDEVFFDLKTNHEAEVLSLALTYDLVSSAGYCCPNIIKI